MSKQEFDAKQQTIECIDDKAVVYPAIPVDVALQEAEDLYAWCQTDKPMLEKAGLDWKLVEDIPLRTGACRYVQSQWQKEYKSLEEAQKEWAAQSPLAYELRDTLLHHFFHAYYRMDDLYSRTQKIAEGNTHADMIQDLSDLAALGKANPQPLTAISVDLALLDKAETLAPQMATLLAKSNGQKMEDNKLRLLRDKAYTYLKKLLTKYAVAANMLFGKMNNGLKDMQAVIEGSEAKPATKTMKRQDKKFNNLISGLKRPEITNKPGS